MSKDGKVCPSCGREPWNFAEGESPKIEGSSLKSCEPRQQPAFCQDCGDKLVPRSELPRDIWKDPRVKERLKDGVHTWDIAVCRCPECDELGYYNEGSTFSCRFCDLTFYVTSDEEGGHREGVRTVSADDVIRLDDTVTECDHGYNNRTI